MPSTRLLSFSRSTRSEYDLDYLLVVAQGYQESMLNQAARHGGAVGIMQVKPSIAAAAPISIPNVTTPRTTSMRESRCCAPSRKNILAIQRLIR